MKKILSNRILCLVIIFALVFGVYGAFLLINGSEHTVYANYSSGNTVETPPVLVFGEDGSRTESDIIECKSVTVRRGYAKAVYKAVGKGTETVRFEVLSVNSAGETSLKSVSENVKVGALNIISLNIYQYIYIAMAVLSLLIFALYLYWFIRTVRECRYSYDAVFFLSVMLVFGLMMLLWGSASVYSFMHYHTASSDILITVNQNFITFLTLGTLPLTAIFAVCVSASNVQLMRKEGFRPTNALGIAVSIAMAVGIVAVFLLYYFSREKKSTVLSVMYSVSASLYVFFVVILVSAIAYGIYASKHTPSYDKDYIIILGCKIKKDGTLYPLVRGRADKAIEFYKAQLEKTGKAACFVPSGGKGNDEVMPEGEAIKRYLIEQGVPEDRIIAETQSATTRENMKFSKSIIDGLKENAEIMFSTTSYHVFRSGAIAHSAGINVEGIGAKTKWYFWPNAFLREIAGIFTTQPKRQIIITALIVLSAGIGSFIYSLI